MNRTMDNRETSTLPSKSPGLSQADELDTESDSRSDASDNYETIPENADSDVERQAIASDSSPEELDTDVVLDGPSVASDLDAIMDILLESVQLEPNDVSNEGPVHTSLQYIDNVEYQNSASKLDQMLIDWRKQLSFRPDYLVESIAETDSTQNGPKDFTWVSVGQLIWVKQKGGYSVWWPGVIKNIKPPSRRKNRKKKRGKDRKVDKVNAQTRVTVMFIEPAYEAFLAYKAKGLSYAVKDVLPFVPMHENRSEEEKHRSNQSWATCNNSYHDNTMFEISERMAVVYQKNKDRILQNGKLDLELLSALYYAAYIIWCKMTAMKQLLWEPVPDIDKFRPSFEELKDVSCWREPAQKRQPKNRRDRQEEEEDNPDGGYDYGYEYIQIAPSRDPSKLEYCDASKAHLAKRTEYAARLLDAVRAPDCCEYLVNLRDAKKISKKHTKRTRAWSSNQMWDLMHQEIRSPSGPIVNDSQVFELYRLMKRLRRKQDDDNVKFMRDCYDVWLPEALIYAIQKIDGVSYQEAEQRYQDGPEYTPEELVARWDKNPVLSMVKTVAN